MFMNEAVAAAGRPADRAQCTETEERHRLGLLRRVNLPRPRVQEILFMRAEREGLWAVCGELLCLVSASV